MRFMSAEKMTTGDTLMRSHPLQRRAFSLVELLVTVAILTLLIALLLPSLGAAKEAARVAGCMSNVRQIAAASLGYTADHHGYFAPTNVPANLGLPYADQGKGKIVCYLLPGAMWLDPIWEKYLNKNIRVLECPDQRSERNTSSTYQYIPYGPSGYRKYYPGYMVNRQTLNHNTYLPTNVAQWSRPSQKILHADSGKRLMNGAYQPEVFDGWGPLSAQWWAGNAQAAWSGAGLSGRHFRKYQYINTSTVDDGVLPPDQAQTDLSGGSNTVFLDGHGEFRNWFDVTPWKNITTNWPAPFNASKDLFAKYWDPDGDANQFTP